MADAVASAVPCCDDLPRKEECEVCPAAVSLNGKRARARHRACRAQHRPAAMRARKEPATERRNRHPNGRNGGNGQPH